MIIEANKFATVSLPISKSWLEINVSSEKKFSAYLLEKEKLEILRNNGTINLSEESTSMQRNVTSFFEQIMNNKGYLLILRNNNNEQIKLQVEVKTSK